MPRSVLIYRDEKKTSMTMSWEANKPWFKYWRWAKRRCTDPKHKSYAHYRTMGILFKLTPKQVSYLWKRDKAHLLECPSLDRKKSKLHYTVRNCRFIEFKENCGRARRKNVFIAGYGLQLQVSENMHGEQLHEFVEIERRKA